MFLVGTVLNSPSSTLTGTPRKNAILRRWKRQERHWFMSVIEELTVSIGRNWMKPWHPFSLRENGDTHYPGAVPLSRHCAGSATESAGADLNSRLDLPGLRRIRVWSRKSVIERVDN
jgi:hypothetical protein